MNDDAQKTADQAAAFGKIWMESLSKMMQAAFASGQPSPPPEMMREMRAGIFQALAQAWAEFMRSPQFLDGMKQWMDNAINFRKLSNDFMAKVRSEMQAPSRDDLDAVMLAVRHMEKRLLDRLEELSGTVGKSGNGQPKGRGRGTAAARIRPANSRKSTRKNGKARKA